MTESGGAECCYAKDRDKKRKETDSNCSVSMHELHCRQEAALRLEPCFGNIMGRMQNYKSSSQFVYLFFFNNTVWTISCTDEHPLKEFECQQLFFYFPQLHKMQEVKNISAFEQTNNNWPNSRWRKKLKWKWILKANLTLFYWSLLIPKTQHFQYFSYTFFLKDVNNNKKAHFNVNLKI